jgi:hypothetical protein
MQLIDHYSPDWVRETQAMIRGWLSQEPRSYVYLLIDASFRHETTLPLIRELWPGKRWRSLYQDAPNTSEQVLSVSPLLLAVDEEALGILEAIARETTGQPMLSLIVTRESLSSLWGRLAAFRFIRVQDNRYVLRLTDTRRLPQIIDMLTEEQRTRLYGQALAWWSIARNGCWRTLDIDSVSTQPPDTLRIIELSEQQAKMLVDMNRTDVLIDSLRINDPELYGAFGKPSERYEWITRVLCETEAPIDTHAQQLDCCREAARKEGLLI